MKKCISIIIMVVLSIGVLGGCTDSVEQKKDNKPAEVAVSGNKEERVKELVGKVESEFSISDIVQISKDYATINGIDYYKIDVLECVTSDVKIDVSKFNQKPLSETAYYVFSSDYKFPKYLVDLDNDYVFACTYDKKFDSADYKGTITPIFCQVYPNNIMDDMIELLSKEVNSLEGKLKKYPKFKVSGKIIQQGVDYVLLKGDAISENQQFIDKYIEVFYDKKNMDIKYTNTDFECMAYYGSDRSDEKVDYDANEHGVKEAYMVFDDYLKDADTIMRKKKAADGYLSRLLHYKNGFKEVNLEEYMKEWKMKKL